MNKTLERAVEKAARVNALLRAVEQVAMDIDVVPEDLGKADDAAHILYVVQEIAESIEGDLNSLQGDMRILDVFEAAKKLHGKEL